MQIWVDADACPNVIKDILYRVAERVHVAVVLVANQPLRTPPSPHIKTIRVTTGFDVADDYIAQHVQVGDLVITADIPLAAAALERGGHALNPRGEMYTQDSVRQRLVMRDLMDQLRGSGVVGGGPPPLSQSDRRDFANALDRFVARYVAAGKPP